MLVGAFNYLCLDEMLEFLRNVDWDVGSPWRTTYTRDSVRLFVQEQDDHAFREMRL